MKVRQYSEIVVLLLRKPALSFSLDAPSVTMFVEMLAEPYPLEPDNRVRMLKVKQTGIHVGTTGSGKVKLTFDEAMETVSMSKLAAARLGEDVTKMCDSLGGANPS